MIGVKGLTKIPDQPSFVPVGESGQTLVVYKGKRDSPFRLAFPISRERSNTTHQNHTSSTAKRPRPQLQAYRDVLPIHRSSAWGAHRRALVAQANYQAPQKENRKRRPDASQPRSPHRSYTLIPPPKTVKQAGVPSAGGVKGKKTRVTRRTPPAKDRASLILIAASPRLGTIPSWSKKNGGFLGDRNHDRAKPRLPHCNIRKKHRFQTGRWFTQELRGRQSGLNPGSLTLRTDLHARRAANGVRLCPHILRSQPTWVELRDRASSGFLIS